MSLGLKLQQSNPETYDFVIAVTVRGDRRFVTGDACFSAHKSLGYANRTCTRARRRFLW